MFIFKFFDSILVNFFFHIVPTILLSFKKIWFALKKLQIMNN